MSASFRFLLLARFFFLAAFLFGISLPIAYAQQPQLFPTLKDAVPSITTTGIASADVTPDIVTISIGVDTERPNAADATRDNARAAQAVVGEIKAQGIDGRDIKTLSITLSPVYDEDSDSNGHVKRTLRGYLAQNSLSVRIRDLAKAGALARQVMDQGANSLEGIEFDYSQKDAKYDALRGDAMHDALRKATSYVNGLGIKLGRVLEIATEPPAPVPNAMSSRMVGGSREASAAAIPVEPGVQTLRAEVQVTWELLQ
ncbi:MAG TPA: SIMPL domain-containing protein [Methylocella sp.]|nr:SIMPL domain-containing protein [Methylocella sp.]